MTIQNILLCIIFCHCSTANITKLGIPEIFPIIPRTSQLVNHRSSRVPSISFHYSQPKENFKKVAKIEDKYDKIVRIVGNTQQTSPIFIKLFNKNLLKGHTIDQPIHPIRSNPNNSNEELELNQLNRWNLSVPESQLKHNVDDEMDTEIEIRELEKPGMTETSCIFNSKKQKYAIFKKYLYFWNLSLESIDFDHNFSDIMHISMLNRRCSTDQKSAFCCEEITKSLKDPTNNDTKICDSSSQESAKCHEFCINPENGHFINSTEYSCQENYMSSFSNSVDWIQTTIYNKTSAIIFGQNENSENPEFRSWAQQILQKLDIALTLNNQTRTTAFLDDEETSDTILLNQRNKFSKFNETIIDRELAWQLLKEYQQYDENISNNLIRICITNQNMAQIICTEQYYYNICHFDESNECIDDIFTAQTSTICRRFKIEDAKVMEITELFCDSLNESLIFSYYQQKASQSTTGIIILELIRTTIIHSIPATTTTIIQLDQNEMNENIAEKGYKYLKMKNDEQAGNMLKKTVKTSTSKMSKIAGNSAEFRETDKTFATTDSITTQMFSEIEKINFTVSENISKFDTTTLEKIATINSNLTNSLKLWQDFDDILNDTIIDITMNSNDIDEINATVEIQNRSINGDSTRKAVIKKDKINFSKPDKQPLWKPFHMDCSIERDESNSTSCNNWAAAGYCLSNNATRFLWCRKTCLCVGPQQL